MALSLNKIEAIKAIKMYFAGPAFFIAENIDAEELINQMNGDHNVYEGYLKALKICSSEKLNQSYNE